MDAERKRNQNSNLSVRQIQDFLEPQMEVNMEHYLLPPKTLLRYALILDIVQPTCRRSVCFTKGWVHYQSLVIVIAVIISSVLDHWLSKKPYINILI